MHHSSEAKLLFLLVVSTVLLVALAVLGSTMTRSDTVDAFLSCAVMNGPAVTALCPIKKGVYTMNMNVMQSHHVMFIGTVASLADIAARSNFCDEFAACGEEDINFIVDFNQFSVTVYQDIDVGEELLHDVNTMVENFHAVQKIIDGLGGGDAARRVRDIYEIAGVSKVLDSANSTS